MPTTLNLALNPGCGSVKQYLVGNLTDQTSYTDPKGALDQNYLDVMGTDFMCDRAGGCDNAGCNFLVLSGECDVLTDLYWDNVYQKTCHKGDGGNCTDFIFGDINRITSKDSQSDNTRFWYVNAMDNTGTVAYTCSAVDKIGEDYLNVMCLNAAKDDIDTSIRVKCLEPGLIRNNSAYTGFVHCNADSCGSMPIDYCQERIDLYGQDGVLIDTCIKDENGAHCQMVPRLLTLSLDAGCGIVKKYMVGSLSDQTNYTDPLAIKDTNYQNLSGETFECDSSSGCVESDCSECDDYADLYIDGVYKKTCYNESGQCTEYTFDDIDRITSKNNQSDNTQYWYVGSEAYKGTYVYTCGAADKVDGDYMNVLCLDSSKNDIDQTKVVKCFEPGVPRDGYTGFVDCTAIECSKIPTEYCQAPLDLYGDDGSLLDTCVLNGSSCSSAQPVSTETELTFVVTERGDRGNITSDGLSIITISSFLVIFILILNY